MIFFSGLGTGLLILTGFLGYMQVSVWWYTLSFVASMFCFRVAFEKEYRLIGRLCKLEDRLARMLDDHR